MPQACHGAPNGCLFGSMQQAPVCPLTGQLSVEPEQTRSARVAWEQALLLPPASLGPMCPAKLTD